MPDGRPGCVLVTRPAADAAGLVRRLAEAGITSVLAPMLGIRFLDGPPPVVAGVQALAATSGNGVRALVHRLAAAPAGALAAVTTGLPLFAVGDATGRTARAAGFAHVESARGDVAALAALIGARLDPAAGAILHIAASEVAGDLAGRLAAAGFACRRDILYAAEAATGLEAAAAAALAAGDVDGVLLFSPRTAATFVGLLQGAGLAEAARRLTGWCLSRAVAERIAPLAWRQTRIAAEPTEAALAALVIADAARRR